MQRTDRRVDWEGIKECLATLHRESAFFLSRSLLIGGAASWFYRIQLRRANDPTFREPADSLAQEDVWLSKDIDFTGIFKADAFDLLPALVAMDERGNRFLHVNGIRLGFAQVGVTFDPEDAFVRARLGEFSWNSELVRFLVMDPVTLYREKQALALKRNQPNDYLHFRTLKEYLSLQFMLSCERSVNPSAENIVEQQSANGFLVDVKSRALEITQDSRVQNRIRTLISQFPGRADFLIDTFLQNE